MVSPLTKVSFDQLPQLLTVFKSTPKFLILANAVEFELRGTLPNHPCSFYSLQGTNKSNYYFCFRRDNLPDKHGPVLMIACDGVAKDSDVVHGLEQLMAVEEEFKNIWIVQATSNLSTPARNFIIKTFRKEEYDFVTGNVFYVPRSSLSMLKKELSEVSLPPGFSLGSTRLSDVEIVNSTWKYSEPEDILQQTEKIKRLPTACIFHDDKPIAFEMIGLDGQLNHQYTFPEFRNRGFGTIIEKSIVAKCIEAGFTPCKAVEVVNSSVLRRSEKNPVWRVVTGAEGGEPLIFHFAVFRPDVEASY